MQSGIALSRKMSKEPVETIFAYSCMARRRFMGEEIVHDIEPLAKIAPLSGFYSYGEIFTTPTSVEITGHTMTLLALSEEQEIYAHTPPTESKINSASAETLNALTSLLRTTAPSASHSGLHYNLNTQQLSHNANIICFF